MAVNWQSIEIPFGGGINTKTNPRRLQPPQLEDIQNLVFTDAPGYRSRYGSAVFTTTTAAGGTISNCEQLARRNNELLLFDNTSLYSYSPEISEWVTRDSVSLPKVDIDVKVNTVEAQKIATTDELNGVRVTAFTVVTSTAPPNTSVIVVEDTATNAILHEQTISNLFSPQVVACTSNIYVFGLNRTSDNVTYHKVSVTDPTATLSATNAKTDLTGAGADKIVAVAKDPTDTDSVLVYYRRVNGGTQSISGFVFDASTDTVGSTVDITTDATHGAAEHIAACANTSFAFLGGSEAGTGETFIYRSTLALGSVAAVAESTVSNLTDVAITTDPSGTSNTPDWFMYQTYSNPFNEVHCVADASFGGVTTLYGNTSLASNGFFANSQNYVVVKSEDWESVVNTFILVNLDDSFKGVAGFFAGSAAHEQLGSRCNVFQDSDGKFVYPAMYAEQVVTDQSDFNAERLALVFLDWTAADRYQSVDVDGLTLFVGGNKLWEYDGRQVLNNGFLQVPHFFGSGGTSAGNLGAGTYNYRVYAEYYDANGNRQRSTYISNKTLTVAASKKLNVQVVNIPQHAHVDAENVIISVYRSEADADVSAGAPFYRVTSLDPADTGADNGYVLNSVSSNTQSFEDNLADADLITKELDYQNTGERDNVPVPDVKYVALAKSRIWAVDTLFKNRCYFSKLRFYGDSFAFNEANAITLPFDNDPDGIVAIAELNHFVVFFKSESIYVVSGDGPDNLGRGFFNEPQRVTSDVGCNEPRSVVAYDGGLLFKSDKGIYRLGQNLQVDYIGAPVEGFLGLDTNEDGNTDAITAATLVNDQNQIRFLFDSGRMLVYDYFVNAWTTFTGWTGVSAVNWRNGDVYCWAESDGTIHQEDSSTFEDNGTPVDTSFTTAPITLQGLGGFYRMQRLMLIGDYSTLTNIEVTPYYDGSTSGTEASVLTSLLDSNDPLRVVFNMPRQKFSDVKFKIVMDKNNSGTSEGVTLQAMRAKVAYKPGLDKLSDGNKFGS